MHLLSGGQTFLDPFFHLCKLGPSLPASEEGEEVVDGDTNEDEEDGDEEEEEEEEEEENEGEICADSGEEEQEVQGRGEGEEDTSEPEASEEDSSLRGIDVTTHPPLPFDKTCYIIIMSFFPGRDRVQIHESKHYLHSRMINVLGG